MINPYAVQEAMGPPGSTAAVGVVLAGAAGLVVLGAGTASADPWDDTDLGSGSLLSGSDDGSSGTGASDGWMSFGSDSGTGTAFDTAVEGPSLGPTSGEEPVLPLDAPPTEPAPTDEADWSPVIEDLAPPAAVPPAATPPPAEQPLPVDPIGELFDGAVDSVDGMVGPVDGAAGLLDGAVGPVDGTADPIGELFDGAVDSVDGTVGPVDSTVSPVDGVGGAVGPVDGTADPSGELLDGATGPIDDMAGLLDGTADPIGELLDSAVGPVDGTADLLAPAGGDPDGPPSSVARYAVQTPLEDGDDRADPCSRDGLWSGFDGGGCPGPASHPPTGDDPTAAGGPGAWGLGDVLAPADLLASVAGDLPDGSSSTPSSSADAAEEPGTSASGIQGFGTGSSDTGTGQQFSAPAEFLPGSAEDLADGLATGRYTFGERIGGGTEANVYEVDGPLQDLVIRLKRITEDGPVNEVGDEQYYEVADRLLLNRMQGDLDALTALGQAGLNTPDPRLVQWQYPETGALQAGIVMDRLQGATFRVPDHFGPAGSTPPDVVYTPAEPGPDLINETTLSGLLCARDAVVGCGIGWEEMQGVLTPSGPYFLDPGVVLEREEGGWGGELADDTLAKLDRLIGDVQRRIDAAAPEGAGAGTGVPVPRAYPVGPAPAPPPRESPDEGASAGEGGAEQEGGAAVDREPGTTGAPAGGRAGGTVVQPEQQPDPGLDPNAGQLGPAVEPPGDIGPERGDRWDPPVLEGFDLDSGLDVSQLPGGHERSEDLELPVTRFPLPPEEPTSGPLPAPAPDGLVVQPSPALVSGGGGDRSPAFVPQPVWDFLTGPTTMTRSADGSYRAAGGVPFTPSSYVGVYDASGALVSTERGSPPPRVNTGQYMDPRTGAAVAAAAAAPGLAARLPVPGAASSVGGAGTFGPALGAGALGALVPPPVQGAWDGLVEGTGQLGRQLQGALTGSGPASTVPAAGGGSSGSGGTSGELRVGDGTPEGAAAANRYNLEQLGVVTNFVGNRQPDRSGGGAEPASAAAVSADAVGPADPGDRSAGTGGGGSGPPVSAERVQQPARATGEGRHDEGGADRGVIESVVEQVQDAGEFGRDVVRTGWREVQDKGEQVTEALRSGLRWLTGGDR